MYAFLSLQFKLPDPLIFFKHFFSFLIKNIKSKGTKLLNFKGCFMVLMNIPCNYFELMGYWNTSMLFWNFFCSLSPPSIFKYNQIKFSGFECLMWCFSCSNRDILRCQSCWNCRNIVQKQNPECTHKKCWGYRRC